MSDSELTTINFRAPNDLRERLEARAEKEHRTLSNYIRFILETTVEPLEDEAKAAK